MGERTADEIRTEMSKVPSWTHSIDLGHGVVTPGTIDRTHQERALLRLDLPPTLEGLSVLDVGCWDGFYSFECERRGASRVLATDKWVWERAWGMDGFLTARTLLNSGVEYKIIDPHEISRETIGEFDVTLFLGVFYHLRDPLAVLDRLAEVTRRQIIVESLVILTPGDEGVPIARFSEGSEFDGDFTNWWVPNIECLVQTVRAAGFGRVETAYDPYHSRSLANHVKDHVKRTLQPLTPQRLHYLTTDRCVVHGFKRHTYTGARNYEKEITPAQLRRIAGSQRHVVPDK